MKFSSLIFLAIFLMMTTSIYSQTTPPIEAGIPIELAKWRANNYSDVRYKLNLTLEKMSPTLKGTIEISLQNNADQIILDWRKISGKENLSSISNVSVNWETAKFEEINEHLVFKDRVKAGVNIIKLDFTSPILTSGSAITRYIDKEDGSEYIYSLFVPSDASTAFPVFDQPDLKARFSVEIDIPTEWNAISNQIKAVALKKINCSHVPCPPIPEGYRRHIFVPNSTPISTYLMTFAVGNFEQFNECKYDINKNPICLSNDLGEKFKTSNIYVRKSQAKKFEPHAQEVFRLNREVVKYLEEYFDYKFPFPKYDLVLIPEFPFGGMEHAGATFLRESSVIFPSEPTKIDHYSRANVIFHEAAHQWFGDTVTMKWFDDLWLKEGFANFMAAKAMEKIMPEMNAWKIFYERTKQSAYATDSTKGTVPIYQDIPNLNSAKSAYGNIVYSKAPAFLRQAEFYLGEKGFQTAVRSFLKKHEYSNATWEDLVSEFETASKKDLKEWAKVWVKQRGLPKLNGERLNDKNEITLGYGVTQTDILNESKSWIERFRVLQRFENDQQEIDSIDIFQQTTTKLSQKTPPFIKGNWVGIRKSHVPGKTTFIFPNYQDYGYGIFLLDEKSRNYILSNVQNEKDDFLRSMMYGSLWDSVREAELNPKDYVELVIKNVADEGDEMIVLSLLNRAGTTLNYYLDNKTKAELVAKLEEVLITQLTSAKTKSLRNTFYRSFLNIVSTEQGTHALDNILQTNIEATPSEVEKARKAENDNNPKGKFAGLPILSTKDKFDAVTKLFILNYGTAPKRFTQLVKTETSDEAKRYAYAAQAGIQTAENKAKYWNDFVNNKELSESWIEAAFGVWNNSRHSNLTLPYLEKALAELPNLKRNRKIFFVNGWLGSFIGGQKSDESLQIVNKFLANNPQLDKDLRLKILENVDVIERAVKIRQTFNK